ncbi:GNAT family N-acetyltransferase [Actinomadura algeriensis]|uniref:RimJ/RimL family protein N-acetyltransferase n=1 Tax=Actinomadura algeriensis TaxID=1679523 RepID=A0ABR9JP52_9ACTN|nr:GNAT family N-acetyltransferase [Actinomadura algeriensis]MBE1532332.1 RimJ/RimL family protein N-acetyltransferase [Actinomadura algeriensis]
MPLRFAELPQAAMRALLAGDLSSASAATGVELTGYFLTDDATFLWRYRLDQLARAPADEPWIVRAAVSEPDGAVVGYSGFHRAPDENGLVEISYSVDPAHRRRGHARAMLAALLDRAAAEPSVRTVRAAISPDNTGSLRTIAGHGFVQVGEQWDEEDGRELLFERPA